MKLIIVVALALVGNLPAQIVKSSSSSGSTTTVCALVDHPAEYSGKVVRIQAKVLSGEEFSILGDDSCPPQESPKFPNPPLVLATYDQVHFDFNSPLNKKLDKKLTKVLKRNEQAEITAVGKFIDPGEYMGHQLCCRYKFQIRQLIAVKDVGKWRP